MEDETLDRRVAEAAFEEDGRKKLTCAAAFRLAAEHGVQVREIGKACNRTGIKIARCQLGCFR